MNIIEYRDAKISELAADMLSDAQHPEERPILLETLDFAIFRLIHSIDEIEDCMTVIRHIRELYWIRDLMKELLYPKEE